MEIPFPKLAKNKKKEEEVVKFSLKAKKKLRSSGLQPLKHFFNHREHRDHRGAGRARKIQKSVISCAPRASVISVLSVVKYSF